MLTGLAFSLWIGFGGPKPPIPRLSQSIAGCSEFHNMTIDSSTEQYVTTTLPSSPPFMEDNYFPLYRLSYMWYAPLGFLITIFVAQIVSRTVTAYLDRRGPSRPKINEQLLSPMFPQCLRTSKHLPEPVSLVL